MNLADRPSRIAVREIPWFAPLLVVILFVHPAFAIPVPQGNSAPYGTFELIAPGLERPSIATLTEESLSIVAPDGTKSNYTRLKRYDTPEGNFIGYSSRELQQVIRWPARGAGNMQIGTLHQGKIQFATSRMTVHLTRSEDRPAAVLPPMTPPGAPMPPPPPAPADGMQNLPQLTPFQFAIGERDRKYLSLAGEQRFQLVPNPNERSSAWFVNPVGKDLVRLQRQVGDRWLALGAGEDAILPPGVAPGRGRRPPRVAPSIGLYPIHGGIEQVWRLHNVAGGGYLFESLFSPGMCLAFPATGGLILEPMVYSPWQVWYPQVPVISIPVPQYQTTSHQFVPNPPLPPIEILLANTHQDELLILLADRRSQQSPQKLRIPAGSQLPVTIERDAGGTIIETVSIRDGFGNWAEEQYTTPVPPSILYDLSVYEIFLQSIAIDRTGTSPNPIEDVNFQPRSIGFFLLPPGGELTEGSRLDVHRIAEEQENPGGVRRLSERDYKNGVQSSPPIPAKDPLKDLLNQFQKQRAAF